MKSNINELCAYRECCSAFVDSIKDMWFMDKVSLFSNVIKAKSIDELYESLKPIARDMDALWDTITKEAESKLLKEK
jgi:RNAse (barnase) inhibitor barstar